MTELEKVFRECMDCKVLDEAISYSEYIPMDLSVSNDELATIDLSSAADFEVYVQKLLDKNNAKVAYGGYIEKRNLYKQANLFNNSLVEERDIHIGLDLWTKLGTSVLAALDGAVHSFKNNAGVGNYGPTIILKHTEGNHEFYTLYGHLSANSLSEIKVGDLFKKGQILGYLGDATVNGGYSPHLHFQIIIDIDANFGDYPGVCSLKNLEYYSKNCPNPNLLLKVD